MNTISYATDFYKTGHIAQYPNRTQYVLANMTARSGKNAKMGHFFDDKTVLIGIQGYISKFLVQAWNTGFFQVPKAEAVRKFKRRMDNALGVDSVSTKQIASLHDLGYLPIRIMALPEGSRVNIKVPYFTIENTISDFYWVTNYLETPTSAETWKPITVATIAYEYRRILKHFADITGSNVDFINWQIHDFSMRGMSGIHDSSVCGAAHLAVGNYGTDSISAIDYLEDYYFADSDKEIVGGSVPATEHSVMCMGGKETEIQTFRRLINDVYPTGIVSIVSDTWDFWKVITETAAELKDEILARKPNALGQAKVVFRPDSGDPVRVICGHKVFDTKGDLSVGTEWLIDNETVVLYNDKHYMFETIETSYDEFGYIDSIRLLDEVSYAEVKGAVQCLWDIFGGTTNEKGFKTLNQAVGLIYGDGITLDRAHRILEELSEKGFAADNVVFGVGSFTYQYITRDTFGMAIKATAGIVDGEYHELFKDPKTDNGTKKSAKGRIRVEELDGEFILHDQQTLEDMQTKPNAMRVVFENGVVYNQQTLAEIRAKLA